jgi:hypothetical protein
MIVLIFLCFPTHGLHGFFIPYRETSRARSSEVGQSIAIYATLPLVSGGVPFIRRRRQVHIRSVIRCTYPRLALDPAVTSGMFTIATDRTATARNKSKGDANPHSGHWTPDDCRKFECSSYQSRPNPRLCVFP